ncbi:MAG: TolC family protein [Planctomycetaceae bacterium]|nr:TolC family protein [Planctomycetaceae bacterium]
MTVATVDPQTEERYLSLDEAIRLSLQHSEVIRVLAGVTAANSGRTIYDTAIAVTPIDVAKARFDPVFQANTSFRRTETPFVNPTGTSIGGIATGGNDTRVGVTDLNRFGGTAAIFGNNRFDNQNNANFFTADRPSMEVSYTQPILAGAGQRANLAPIVVARLQQEQSYFQFKGAMQNLVRDTITAYWNLVQARTELWAREIQVEQLKFSFELKAARKKRELDDIKDVAQAKAAYLNARGLFIQAQGSVLQREAALRNLIGLPPEDGLRLVPSTPPTRDRVEFRWDEIVETAQARRPDIIELNLVLQADQETLIQRKNLARPSLDAVALHRWNGLTGTAIASGDHVDTGFNNHTDWTLGVNFSVPLSLRESRARVRNTELLITKDRANIQQAIHQTEHALATSLRSLDLSLEQYEAYREARAASAENVVAQMAEREVGRVIFLNQLVAITEWANAVVAEAQSLISYNNELANLEQQTGTILETHGIRFVEERFASIGPHGWCQEEMYCYPKDLNPENNADKYQSLEEPSEKSFGLEDFQRIPGTPLPAPLPDQTEPPLKPEKRMPDQPAEPDPEKRRN